MRFHWILFIMVTFITFSQALAETAENQETVTVVTMMKNTLNLSDTQVKAIIPMMYKYFKQVQEMRVGAGDKSQLSLRIKSLREDLDSNLAHYLRDDQMTMWKTQFPLGDGKDSSVNEKEDHSTPAVPQKDTILESGTINKTKSSGIW